MDKKVKPSTINHEPLVIGIDASRAFVPEPAGPEYYSWHLIKNISKLDKTNHYVLYLRPGQKANFRLPKNFEVKVIPLPYLWTQLGLALETILSPPDVLFIPAHTLPFLTRFFRPALPTVVTIHGLEGKFLPQTGWFLSHIYRNWSISWAIRLAHRLVAVSTDTKRDIIKTFKLPESRAKDIKVIHEGVDYSRFALTKNAKRKTKKIKEVKEKYGISGNYVLFVGTVQPRKNLIRLIKAFALLLKKVEKEREREDGLQSSFIQRLQFSNRRLPKTAHQGLEINHSSLTLVVAGKLGWLYEKILIAPKRFGIENKVKFTGRVDDQDLPALYWGAKAFAFPSLTEGFGLPILEAQAAGIPVIAAKTGAIPEVARSGALFVNPKSAEDIRKGLLKIMTDKKLRRELVRKGRKNARKFSWELAAYNTLNFLLESRRN